MAVFFQITLVALAAGAIVLCVMLFRRSGGSANRHVIAHVWSDEALHLKVSHQTPLQTATDHHSSESHYRVRPGSSQVDSHWDPYAAEQSRVHRVQSARRKPRPHPSAPKHRYVGTAESSALDSYTILGVRPDASMEEIERAYRRYAAAIHPDRFFDDPRRRREAEEKLKQLNAIMQLLRDPGKRAAYDASR